MPSLAFRVAAVSLFAAVGSVLAAEPAPLDIEPARSPAESQRAIQLRPGLKIELVAAEPLVMDPVAIAWGADGKLWVVEMGDYPLGAGELNAAGGRVRFLEDTNGDGRYDRSTLFLDGLNYPNGVMPWRKGVLVTCAPEIFYAEDTDGDGKADVRKTLFRGFGEGNQQHRVNGLRWGLDNWVYCASGDGGAGGGGTIESLANGRKADIRGRDIRIRPDTGEFDPTSGPTQFGLNRDAWGNWFGSNNAQPMYHFVLADQYLRRNPNFAAPDPKVQVSVTPGAARLYGLSRPVTIRNPPVPASAPDYYSSACSAMVYDDELFGPEYAGNAFICDPVNNLVHREIMSPQGYTFTSQRAADEQTSEFLASRDAWTRPTMILAGPDGALWVVDMYRLVIEHPQWIEPSIKERIDLRAGHDLGRIYRITPSGVKPRAIPRLDKLSPAQLVAAIDSPSAWQRDTAQQLLLWKNDKSVVPAIEKLSATSKRPTARLQALCTLEGLGALEPKLIVKALGDAHPGVRRHAIRLAEPLLESSPELGPALAALVNDADPQVQLQLACSLGAWSDERAGLALGRLATIHADQRFLRAAVLCSLDAKLLPAALDHVLQQSPPPTQLTSDLVALAVAGDNRAALARTLKLVLSPREQKYLPWQMASTGALLRALAKRNLTLEDAASAAPELAPDVRRLAEQMHGHALKTVVAAEAAEPERLAALAALGLRLAGGAGDIETMAKLLTPQTPPALQQAAVEALANAPETQVATVLLAGWRTYGPDLRAKVLDLLLTREPWATALLDAIQSKTILTADLNAPRRRKLTEHPTEAIRTRAGKLLTGSVDADRQRVIDEHLDVLKLAASPDRGVEVFKKRCGVCHRLENVGVPVGPDLDALRNKTPEALLIAILDPNRALEPRYLNYVAVTDEGLTLSGLLLSETGNSLTIASADGKQHVIGRASVETLQSTGKSVMPEGLERDLSRQDLADVIAYIGRFASERKTVPGNEPQVVKVSDDGQYHLLAATGELFGERVGVNVEARCIAWMAAPEDHVVWTIEAAKPGRYEVHLEWAQIDDFDGNPFEVHVGESRIAGRFPTTGGWEKYRRQKFGVIELKSGLQKLTLRPGGPVNTELADIRALHLVPVAKGK